MAKLLAQCLKDISYKLGLIADYVVEEDTSGIWTYEKWNSGKIKMTGRTSNNLIASDWVAHGTCYYNVISEREFPFTLASVTYFNWNIQNPYGYMLFKFSNPYSDKGVSTSGTGNLAAGRFTKPSVNLPFDLFFEVEGTWK